MEIKLYDWSSVTEINAILEGHLYLFISVTPLVLFHTKTALPTGPDLASDLNGDNISVLDESASKTPKSAIRQTRLEKLRAAEIRNKSLKSDLSENDKTANTAIDGLNTTIHKLRKSQGKEIEQRKITQHLKERMEELEGQLYGNQSQQFILGIPMHNMPDESKHYDQTKIVESTWLNEPGRPDEIAESQRMATEGKYQPALIHLDLNIPRSSPIVSHANAVLLKSYIFRISKDPERGLGFAEHVVHVASQENLPTLLCKAQLYRGLCLSDLGWYADAGWCFTRAANIKWFAREVAHLTAVTEEKRRALPDGRQGKQLSAGFSEIPLYNYSVAKRCRNLCNARGREFMI